MTEPISWLETTHNPHFSQFVAVLSVPYGSRRWREDHATIPFWTRTEHLAKLLRDDGLAQRTIKEQFLIEFLKFMVELTTADPKLFYRPEDMDWLAKTLDSPYATAIMSMLLAYASSVTSYLTPVEIADLTGTAESGWRNKAAAGELVGARKAGKQWLIPVTTLRAYGLLVDAPGRTVGDVEEREQQSNDRD